ncbi:MAG: hypothetical protein ACJ8AG_17235, partial [Ktedonobacteraceae bacterium]
MTQALHLVQGLRVSLAVQRGRWSRAELRRVVQYKGSHVTPGGENGCREVRRRGLVVARLAAWHKGRQRGSGTVIGADGDQACGDGVADLDSLLL